MQARCGFLLTLAFFLVAVHWGCCFGERDGRRERTLRISALRRQGYEVVAGPTLHFMIHGHLLPFKVSTNVALPPLSTLPTASDVAAAAAATARATGGEGGDGGAAASAELEVGEVQSTSSEEASRVLQTAIRNADHTGSGVVVLVNARPHPASVHLSIPPSISSSMQSPAALALSDSLAQASTSALHSARGAIDLKNLRVAGENLVVMLNGHPHPVQLTLSVNGAPVELDGKSWSQLQKAAIDPLAKNVVESEQKESIVSVQGSTLYSAALAISEAMLLEPQIQHEHHGSRSNQNKSAQKQEEKDEELQQKQQAAPAEGPLLLGYEMENKQLDDMLTGSLLERSSGSSSGSDENDESFQKGKTKEETEKIRDKQEKVNVTESERDTQVHMNGTDKGTAGRIGDMDLDCHLTLRININIEIV